MNKDPDFSDVECYELLKLIKKAGFHPEPGFSVRELKAVIFWLDKMLNGHSTSGADAANRVLGGDGCAS